MGIVVLAIVIHFVHKDVAHLGPSRRHVILAGAILATLMLIALALNPKLIRTWPDPRKPICRILVDGSRSMLFSDKYQDELGAWLAGRMPGLDNANLPIEATRAEVVKTLLTAAPDGWLGALREEFELSSWRFASELQPLALDETVAAYEVDPEGYATAIGKALEESSAGLGGARPRAMVLFSDGAWNTGPDPSEVSRVLGRLGIPVYVVGLGEANPPREVAVLSVRGPKSVQLGDKLFLRAQIAATGMGVTRLPVQLISDGKVIKERQMVTLPSGQSVDVSFSVVQTVPGRKLFRVRIPKQVDEQDESNNAAGIWVDVIERKINVLLIESEPRWEFRFIRNVFERDPTISVATHLLRPGVGPIVGEGYLKELPKNRKELTKYDLVILGDVDPAKLGETFLEELAEMVRRRSAALIVIAGRGGHYRELAGTPLAEILPVSLASAIETSGSRGVPFHLEPTQEGVSHLITRLDEEPEQNEALWLELPKMNFSASVSGLVPGATALLVHPYRIGGTAKLPLVAVHRVGSGKVMFCGVEETWRWRKAVGDQYHYRFWAQTARWMAKKGFSEGDPRSQLSIARTQCDLGEKVEIEAYCLDPDGFPLAQAQVRLRIEHADGQVQQLAMHPAPGGWGIYRANFTPTKPGNYKIQPIVSVYGSEPLPSTVSLEVVRVDLEKNFWAQDHNSLLAIAQASGGKYLDLSQVDQLPSLLAAKKERTLLTAEYSLCRHWAYYLVLAGILATAWLIRKRSGLA